MKKYKEESSAITAEHSREHSAQQQRAAEKLGKESGKGKEEG
jgi:hypothetical protein